jgi:hypothetical protein
MKCNAGLSLAFCALALLAAPARAGTAASQPITDQELIRRLNRASETLSRAQRDAERGSVAALRESLNKANAAWESIHRPYYHWQVGDAEWHASLDHIFESLQEAIYKLTPGDDLAGAKEHIDAASATLAALRERNGVPDVRASVKALTASLSTLQKSVVEEPITSISASDLLKRQDTMAEVRTNWNRLIKAVVDTNSLGLDDERLGRFKRLVTIQGQLFDALNTALTNNAVQTFVSESEKLAAQLGELVAAAGQEAEDTTEAESEPKSDAGKPERPRPLRDLLQRRRR